MKVKLEMWEVYRRAPRHTTQKRAVAGIAYDIRDLLTGASLLATPISLTEVVAAGANATGLNWVDRLGSDDYKARSLL